MRGTAACFRIDAASFLTDSRAAAFTAADVGGLLCLLCHAWVGGGSVPASADSLAALSKLGGAWADSRLAAAMHLFFRADGGKLVSLDLEGQLARQQEVSRVKAAAGRASGAARGGQKIPPPSQNEHVFNICSTDVQHMLERAGGVGDALQEGVQPSQGPSPAPGSVKCTAFSPPEADAGRAPEPCFSVPPHTPLYREDSLSPSLDGGVGEGSAENPLPRDLFGTPIKPRGRPRKARPTQAMTEAASLVVDAYMDEVRPLHTRTKRADDNAAYRIAEGAEPEQLRQAVRNYARYCDAVNRDPLYRDAPHNFFSRQKATWRAYLKEPEHAAGTFPGGQPGRAGRVRTGVTYDGIGVEVQTADADAPRQEGL